MAGSAAAGSATVRVGSALARRSGAAAPRRLAGSAGRPCTSRRTGSPRVGNSAVRPPRASRSARVGRCAAGVAPRRPCSGVLVPDCRLTAAGALDGAALAARTGRGGALPRARPGSAAPDEGWRGPEGGRLPRPARFEGVDDRDDFFTFAGSASRLLHSTSRFASKAACDQELERPSPAFRARCSGLRFEHGRPSGLRVPRILAASAGTAAIPSLAQRPPETLR